jgi:glycosyltransferase involved in cell wall biosynthesis
MRKGKNSSKERLIEINKSQHRVIIPLYIPHETGYYKDSYSIFKLCINSLIKTAFSPIKVAVVSNGSSDEVNERLIQLYKTGIINELIVERDAIGKLNSVLKVLRTCDEPYVTISDADILFDNNWEKEVIGVFQNFPKAAAVSPIPVFRTQNHYTSNIIFDYFFSKKLQFTKVKNPEALTLFAKSIGWSRLDHKWKNMIMTIKSKTNVRAVVGCNHSVVTYNRSVFNNIPKDNSLFQLGGDSEGTYLDIPPLLYDGYRLATEDNFAFHMGNNKEKWMENVFCNLSIAVPHEIPFLCKPLKEKRLINLIKNYLFKKIISFRKFRRYFYTVKGLPKEQLDFF